LYTTLGEVLSNTLCVEQVVELNHHAISFDFNF